MFGFFNKKTIFAEKNFVKKSQKKYLQNELGGKNVKGSRQCEGGVKARSNKSQGKVKVRSRQRKHNLDLNYNLMGFDTIEINLVLWFIHDT